jgi:hypothetical protein
MDNAELEKLREALGRREVKAEPQTETTTENGDTITLNGTGYSFGNSTTITASTNSTGSLYSSIPSLGNFTISNTLYNGASVTSTSVGTGYNWTNNTSNTLRGGLLEVDGDSADIKINGKSLKAFMEKMEQRMAILVPDPEKLEHFEALKRAYDHYRTLEALCELPKPEEDN